MDEYQIMNKKNTRLLAVVFAGLSLAQICSGADSVLTSAALDEAALPSTYRLAIGYDQGISVRYFLAPATSLSFIGRPSTRSEYGSMSSTDFYSSENSTHQYSSSDYRDLTQSNTTSKGMGLFLQVAHVKDLLMGFSVSPYVQLGGTYATYTTSITNQSKYIGEYSYNHNSTSTHTNSYNATTANLELGFMPGYSYKRLMIQFKLGIGGEMTIQDPEKGNVGDDGKSKRGYFKYPMYDMINSLSIHLAIL